MINKIITDSPLTFSNRQKETNTNNYLKDYLVDFDLKQNKNKTPNQEIESSNNDNETVNLYNDNSYLPNLVKLINEKNKFIDEIKNSFFSMKNKFSDQEQEFKKEIINLNHKLIEKSEKIKILSNNDKFQLVDYYENEITKINKEYENFYILIKISLENAQITQNDKKNTVFIPLTIGSI